MPVFRKFFPQIWTSFCTDLIRYAPDLRGFGQVWRNTEQIWWRTGQKLVLPEMKLAKLKDNCFKLATKAREKLSGFLEEVKTQNSNKTMHWTTFLSMWKRANMGKPRRNKANFGDPDLLCPFYILMLLSPSACLRFTELYRFSRLGPWRTEIPTKVRLA